MKRALTIAVMALAMSTTTGWTADRPLYPITIRSFGVRSGGCTFIDQNNRTFTVQGSPQLVTAVVMAATQRIAIGVTGISSPGSNSMVVHSIFWPADNQRARAFR
jgi:hypothetical protein